MVIKASLFQSAAIALLAFLSAPALAQEPDPLKRRYALEIEGGSVWQSRNDVRIPNATGTSFSLLSLQGRGAFGASRLYLTYALNTRQELRLLIAPLSYTRTGVPSGAIAFAGKTLAAGAPTAASYRFNSYRLTWRRKFYERNQWTWKFGFTLKIRDAEIALRQNGITASDSDLGVVPLLNLAGEWRFAPRWSMLFDMDGLAAPQGRAFDAALKIAYDISPLWTVSAGYRTLEGGADVPQVYNFAWLNYLVFSASYRF